MSHGFRGACGLALVLAGAPVAAAAPFTLSPDATAQRPRLAVDERGTGHVVWGSGVGLGADVAITYCRLPRDATACAETIALTTEGAGIAFGGPHVIASPPATVAVLAPLDGAVPTGTYAYVSTDGGLTFAAPRRIGTLTVGGVFAWPGTPRLVITDAPGDLMLFPGFTGAMHLQTVTLDGPPATRRMTVAGSRDHPYHGSVGFPLGGPPVVVYGDGKAAYRRRWSGRGDPNRGSTWRGARRIGRLCSPAVANGPSGPVLAGGPCGDFGRIAALRVDWRTGRVGRVALLTGRDYAPQFDITQDAAGRTAVVWPTKGAGGRSLMRYRTSVNGGRSWAPRSTLLSVPRERIFNPRIAAAPDGGGFVVWDHNDRGTVRAVPVPVPAAG